MPTFCELVGDKKFPKKYLNKKLEGDCFDGISFAPTLLGQDERQAKHDFLYWEFHETDQIGLRMGDWKLVVVRGVPRLYDLATDIHEDHDVAAQHPDIVYHQSRAKKRVCQNKKGTDNGLFFFVSTHPYASSRKSCTSISFVDSTPLRVCRNQGLLIHKTFKGLAAHRKCPMWKESSVFKHHLIINDKGEILNFIFTPRNVDTTSLSLSFLP